MGEAGPSARLEAGRQSLRRARFSARAPRHLALIVLLVFCALGLRAAFLGPAAASAPRPPAASADAPSEDFALQFARAYLSFDAARPGRRIRSLAPFLGPHLPPDAGFSPARGAQRVEWAEVASDQPALQGGRVITVAAAVSSQRLPLYLALSVRHQRGGPLELIGYPALVGAPSISSAPPPELEAVSDPALSQVADRVLRNYLASAAPDLRADLSPAAEVTLPTRRLRLEEVQQLAWIPEPASGAVLATVLASDGTGTTYTLTYELGIEDRERPYVDFIEVVPTAS